METLPDWNVFFPIQCLKESSGNLVGTYDKLSLSICVTGIIRSKEKMEYSKSRKIFFLGVWLKGIFSPATNSCTTGYNCDEGRCQLHMEATRGYPIARMSVNSISGRCLVILYNSDSLARSYPLMCPASIRHDIVKRVSYSLNASYHEMPTTQGSCRNFATQTHDSRRRHRESKISIFLVFKIYHLLSFIKSFFNSQFFNNKLMVSLANTPSVLLQITSRFNALLSVVKPVKRVTAKQLLRRGDVLCGHLFDVCLGIAVLLAVNQYDTAELLSELLLHWADKIVSYLQKLLHWMTGEPGGLKLNNQLDQFLGKFFLYHIYLWTGYLQLLAPSMRTSISYIALSGCFGGLSMQLSLAQDMLSLMTLHIYCFYVYATKLYRLQLLALATLWRLFVGKKWNILRKRVDSASFDIDQLFLGTLLFTILIFLMPTTAFFYTVFMMLRVLVLAAQGTLYKVAVLLNSFPLYKLYLRCLHPAAVADDIDLRICETSICDTSLCLHLKFIPMPLSKIFHAEINNCEVFDRSITYTWSNFLYSIMVGEIIYPWVRKDYELADCAPIL